jgi:hypothetical protein
MIKKILYEFFNFQYWFLEKSSNYRHLCPPCKNSNCSAVFYDVKFGYKLRINKCKKYQDILTI